MNDYRHLLKRLDSGPNTDPRLQLLYDLQENSNEKSPLERAAEGHTSHFQ